MVISHLWRLARSLEGHSRAQRYPRELREDREDVVRTAREGVAPGEKVAADPGIAEACLRNRIGKAGVDEVCPGVTETESG